MVNLEQIVVTLSTFLLQGLNEISNAPFASLVTSPPAATFTIMILLLLVVCYCVVWTVSICMIHTYELYKQFTKPTTEIPRYVYLLFNKSYGSINPFHVHYGHIDPLSLIVPRHCLCFRCNFCFCTYIGSFSSSSPIITALIYFYCFCSAVFFGAIAFVL